MDKIIKFAKIYSQEGYSVIPVDENKQPAIKSWYVYQKRPMTGAEVDEHFKNAKGIALLTGGRNQITAIDFDLKYDVTGELFDKYKRKIPRVILDKLLVHTTKNNGYHFIFTCDTIEGNQKLAQRETTDDEVLDSYQKYMKGDRGVKKSMELALLDKVRVLIETRGGEYDKCGGYVVIPPTEGYSRVAGKLGKISVEEYDILISAAREFNTYVDRNKRLAAEQAGFSKDGNSPFDNFNERGDVLPILLANGWTEVRQFHSDVRLKRPGQSHSKSSALYDRNSRLLNVFTTSSVFETGAHTPADVFIKLECNDDVKLAYKKLVELGYTDEK